MNRRDTLKAAVGGLLGLLGVRAKPEAEYIRRARAAVAGLPDCVSVEGTPHLCGKVRIYLDGVEQQHCISARTSTGVVTRFALDEQGRIAISLDRTEALREVAYGQVRIEWKDSPKVEG